MGCGGSGQGRNHSQGTTSLFPCGLSSPKKLQWHLDNWLFYPNICFHICFPAWLYNSKGQLLLHPPWPKWWLLETLCLPSDYQTTETMVPKELEFSWESHAGRRKRRKPCSSQTSRPVPRKRVHTILICQATLQRLELRTAWLCITLALISGSKDGHGDHWVSLSLFPTWPHWIHLSFSLAFLCCVVLLRSGRWAHLGRAARTQALTQQLGNIMILCFHANTCIAICAYYIFSNQQSCDSKFTLLF